MRFFDLARLSLRAVAAHKLRSALTALGIIIGIASVVILTAIGEGIHRFVLGEFTQFGTNLIAITPGKSSVFGLSGATISNVRPLSLDDAASLKRLDNIVDLVPVVQGNARIEAETRQRRASVFGVSSAVPEVWKINVDIGSFLPEGEERNPRSFAVLGSKLRDELFGVSNPLGRRIRIGADRYRVVGVMEKKGQMLGFDMDDSVYIPTAKAMEMFDRESLMEIDLLYAANASADSVSKAVKRMLVARHGQEDFTLITQNQMLETLDSVLNILTMAVGALGGISLLVGSVGILTIMSIAVSERISEIGLLRAIGAEKETVFYMFLAEALALSAAGGLGGIGFGVMVVQLLSAAVPALPAHLVWEYLAASFAASLLIGLVSGVVPAMKAAGLQPLEALRTE
ncbi:MAG: ABC transporter permease [Gammaproteobacteria bacterium]